MTLTDDANVSGDARCSLCEKTKKKKKNLGFPGESPPEGQNENLRHYWLRSIILVRREGEAKRVWVGSARRLPRYTTRAYDVTRPVTRAPCALGHVSCHALAASPLLSVHSSPPATIGSPLSLLLSNSSPLLCEPITLEMYISRPAALPLA